MSYNVVTIKTFDDNAKKLSKKYQSLKGEISDLIDLLEDNPFTGTTIGKGCYKIRLKVKSKGKGKSGGARVITYVYIIEETVFLLTIFDKSEKENLTDKEIYDLLNEL